MKHGRCDRKDHVFVNRACMICHAPEPNQALLIEEADRKAMVARHFDLVRSLGCIACRHRYADSIDTPAWKMIVERTKIHHVRFDQGMGLHDDMKVIPLCNAHHQTGGLGAAIHAGQESFEDNFGREEDLLKEVEGLLKEMNSLKLIYDLKPDEGCPLVPNLDSTGHLTVGWGHRTDRDEPVTQQEADAMLEEDVMKAYDAAMRLDFWPVVAGCDVRKRAIVEMEFNLGDAGVRGFVKMAAAIELKDWRGAADQVRNSLAHVQLPARYDRITDMIEQGALME